MRLSDSGNQNISRSNDYSVEEILSDFKITLCTINNVLGNLRQLRKIDDKAIEDFINDLCTMIDDIDRYNLDAYITGTNTFCEKIKQAIFDFQTALDVLDDLKQGEFNANVKRQYYKCLDNARCFIEEALQLEFDTS